MRRPSLFAFMLLLAGLVLFVNLGLWQLGRAEFKHLLLQAETAALQAPPRSLPAALAEPGVPMHRVSVSGRYETDRNVYLDNQIREGQPGVQVYTPFRDTDSGRWILVERGWIPWTGPREVLPEAPTPFDEIHFEALLAEPPGAGLALADDTVGPGQSWPMLVVALQPDKIARALGHALEPRILRLMPESPTGFRRDSRSRIAMPPERHRAYAFQWFSLALAICVVFVVVHWRRKDNENE